MHVMTIASEYCMTVKCNRLVFAMGGTTQTEPSLWPGYTGVRMAPEGISNGSAIHYTVLRSLVKCVYESYGSKPLMEIKATFLGYKMY